MLGGRQGFRMPSCRLCRLTEFAFLGGPGGAAVLPGCAPGGAVTFFCFAKRKLPKKRRAEVRAATRFLALLAPRGRRVNSPCGLKHTRLLIPSPLRCSALPDGKNRTTNNPQGRAMARPCRFRYSASPAVMRRRVAQEAADQEAQMFEPAGRVSALPADSEQRSVPA